MILRFTCALTAILLGCHQVSVHAGGIIQRSPEPGTWVRYDVEFTDIEDNDADQIGKNRGKLLIRFLEDEIVDRQQCRWVGIRFDWEPYNRRQNQQVANGGASPHP